MPEQGAKASAPVQDELFRATEKLLYRMHLDYNQPQPDDDYRSLMAMSWSDHFRKNGVPPEAVLKIYENAAATRAAAGRFDMPNHAALLQEWGKLLEDGYWEKQNRPALEILPALGASASGPGAQPLPGGVNTDKAPGFAKVFAQHGRPVVCFCRNGRDGSHVAAQLNRHGESYFWECARGPTGNGCNFSARADDLEALQSASALVAEQDRRSREAAIVAALEHCGFNIEKVGHERAVAFGEWLGRSTPPRSWTRETAREKWSEWTAQNAKVAA